MTDGRESTGSRSNGNGGNGGGTFGSYDDDYTHTESRGRFSRTIDPLGRLEAIPDMFRHLASEISTLVSLQIALLKAEIKDGVKGYAKGTAMLIAAAVPAVLTFLFLEIALGFLLAALFPFSMPVNYALGFGLVMLLNGIAAGLLAWMGIKQFKSHSLVPERSIQEIEREKQWLANETI